MAITSTIDVADPDGTTKKVSYLDNSIRQHKVDVRERMEDSIIDTGVTGWLTTTSKELKEGLARIATGLVAARATFTTDFAPQTLKDGKVFLSTNATNSQSLDYYDGAAWTAVPIGTTNLLSDSVTTAKILDANVTTAKILANAVSAIKLAATNTTDDTVTGVTPTLIGTTSGDDFTITFTPNSATSIIVCILQVRPSMTGGSTRTGWFNIEETTGATVLGTFRTTRQADIDTANAAARIPMTCISFQTGVTGSRTYVGKMYTANAADTVHLKGDESTASFTVLEFLR
jgi:hypothetical protein